MSIISFPSKPTCKEELHAYIVNMHNVRNNGERAMVNSIVFDYQVDAAETLIETMQINSADEMVQAYTAYRARIISRMRRVCLDSVVLKMLKNLGESKLYNVVKASIALES